MRERMVDVIDGDGRVLGTYPIVLGGALATREGYNAEARVCAIEDGLSEEAAAACRFEVRTEREPADA